MISTKLNNKGLTVVELLASFVLISIIVVGMLSVVFNYRAKATLSVQETKLMNYQVSITKDIMNDVVTKGVSLVSSCGDRCVSITFSDDTTSKIEVPMFDSYELVKNKYIKYNGRMYDINENIPNVDDYKNYQNIVFGDKIDLTTKTLGDAVIYSIDYSVTHVDLNDDYGLHFNFFKSEG